MQSLKSLVPGSFVLFSAFLISSGIAAEAFTINTVVNAASRTPSGVASYGIAQGAVFAVTGTGVGQDPPTQATFPLPTSAGLNGVSIKVAAGGTSLDAIMVYVSANEVDAILPSATPLGTATITVTNGDTTATAPITVVKSAFGIFTTTPAGLGQAMAFTANDDGTTSLVSPVQPAHAGQTVTIAGTGLGAIASDETQSGATDIPSAGDISIWVGTTQVPVASAGRGSCCTGIDPTYPIPPGVAGWDLVSFVVPGSVSGCGVSVAVQIGNTVSNVSSVAIAGTSGVCLDLSGITFDPTGLSGVIKYSLTSFTRLVARDYEASGTSNVTSDVGASTFQAIDVGQNYVFASSFANFISSSTTGSCSAFVFRFDRNNPPPTTTFTPGTPPVILDAGPAINVKGPVGSKPMPKGKDGGYGASFASVISIPLPGGLPPIQSGGPPFLEAGSYAVDNGGGGADIGPFNATLNFPKANTWDNIEQVATVDRTKGVTVKWSGGDPNTVVGIAGSATVLQGTVSLSGSFVCTEKASAGQFTVPPYVTLNMPQVSGTTSPTSPGSVGNMTVSTILYQYVTIPGVDLSIFSTTSGTGRNVGFQ